MSSSSDFVCPKDDFFRLLSLPSHNTHLCHPSALQPAILCHPRHPLPSTLLAALLRGVRCSPMRAVCHLRAELLLLSKLSLRSPCRQHPLPEEQVANPLDPFSLSLCPLADTAFLPSDAQGTASSVPSVSILSPPSPLTPPPAPMVTTLRNLKLVSVKPLSFLPVASVAGIVSRSESRSKNPPF